jgi:hypothetical protein
MSSDEGWWKGKRGACRNEDAKYANDNVFLMYKEKRTPTFFQGCP